MNTRKNSLKVKKETSGRGSNYTSVELDILLELIELHLPLGQSKLIFIFIFYKNVDH